MSFVVQAGSFVLLARLLDPGQYGLLAGAVALVMVVSQFGAMGAGQLFMRYVSADADRFRAYWGNAILSVLFVGGLIALLVWGVGPIVTNRESTSILVLLAVSECVFVQLTACASMVFQTKEKMKISASLALLTSALRFLLALGMLLSLGKTTAYAWSLGSLVVSILVALTAVWMVTQNYGLPNFSLPLMFRRLGEGFVFAISGSTTSVYNDVDKVMLSHEGMLVADGIYSMAYRVINIGTMPVMSLVGAAFPRFFQVGVGGPKAVMPLAKTLLKRALLLGTLATVGMFFFSPLLPRLVGASYLESARALRWLCLIPVFRCFHLSAGDALSGSGDQKFRLLCQGAAAVGNLALNWYLIPRYSWLGAAWASLITDGGLGVMTWLALIYLARKPWHGRQPNDEGGLELTTMPVE